MAKQGKSGESGDEFMARVRRHAGAPAAISVLIGKGVGLQDLRQWLWVLAELEGLWHRRSSPLRNRLRAGMPMYTLDRFPEQVRRWATKISAFQKAMKSDPATAIYLELLTNLPSVAESSKHTPEQWSIRMKILESLPIFLNDYAKIVQAIVALFRTDTKFVRDQAYALRELFVFYVRTVTGRPHFAEISTVVNAAYEARKLESNLDQQAIQRAYARSKLVKYFKKEPDASVATAEIMETVRTLSASLSRVVYKTAA